MALRPSRIACQEVRRKRVSTNIGVFVTRVYSVPDTGEDVLYCDDPKNMAEVRHRTLGLLHHALRIVPYVREQLSVAYSRELLNGTVLDLFRRYADIKDVQIATIMQHKCVRELQDYKDQHKGEQHVYALVKKFEEKQFREQIEKDMEAHSVGETVHHKEQLRRWHRQGLVPSEIRMWSQYVKWKKDQGEKFSKFATETGIFTPEELAANAVVAEKAGCSIM